MFIAVGSHYDYDPISGNSTNKMLILTSRDGSSWSQELQPTSGTSDYLQGVTFGDGQFVAVGYRYDPSTYQDTGAILTSPDGMDWTQAFSGTNRLVAVAYGNGRFVAAGDNSGIVTSSDGVNWSRENVGTESDNIYFNGVTYGDGDFVATGMSGLDMSQVILTSQDGINWTFRNPGTWGFLSGITSGLGEFVAVGGNIIMQSGDLTGLDPNPKLFIQPSSEIVPLGGNTQFNVSSDGSPPISYQWMFNGQDILNATNSTLTLNSVTIADAGVYSVIVSNPYGLVTSSLASLVIQGDPANWNPSFVTVTPQTAPADGSTPVTATVTLLDKNYNPLVGKTVTFYAQPASTAPIPLPMHPTDSKGQTTTTITSTTAGKMAIGAIDVSDGFPVPNSATVQFTTGSVVPGTGLANAITQLANSSSDILNNRLASDAISEGQDGDYFKATLSSDERANGVNALFTGIGSLITVLGPENDLIKETGMQVAESEGISLGLDIGSVKTSDALDAIAKSDTGFTTYGQQIASNNQGYQQSEYQREQQLLNGVPPAAQNLSSAYASAIGLRVQANQDLNTIILAQKNMISDLRLQSQQAHIDLLSKIFMPINVVSTLAQDGIPVGGKVAGAALGLAESFDSYAFNQPNLSFGANAVNTVDTAMLDCSYYSRLVDGNTESAFSEIAAGKSPNPVTGKMSSVNSVPPSR